MIPPMNRALRKSRCATFWHIHMTLARILSGLWVPQPLGWRKNRVGDYFLERSLMSNARCLILLLFVALLQGCNACWITKPADPIETVTLYSVRFHEYLQPGSFSAFLDGENVTRQFAPAPAPKG